MHESREHGADNMVVFVAATKSDILTRKVTEKEGREWAQAQGFHYHEVMGGNDPGGGGVGSGIGVSMP